MISNCPKLLALYTSWILELFPQNSVNHNIQNLENLALKFHLQQSAGIKETTKGEITLGFSHPHRKQERSRSLRRTEMRGSEFSYLLKISLKHRGEKQHAFCTQGIAEATEVVILRISFGTLEEKLPFEIGSKLTTQQKYEQLCQWERGQDQIMLHLIIFHILNVSIKNGVWETGKCEIAHLNGWIHLSL